MLTWKNITSRLSLGSTRRLSSAATNVKTPVTGTSFVSNEIFHANAGIQVKDESAFHGHTPSRLFVGATPIKVVGDVKMGMTVPNADLQKTKEWSAADVAEIKKQLHEHSGVLTFTNQSADLSPQEHMDFASRFGELEVHTAVKGIPGYPEVMQIEREPTSEVIFGEDFHSDHSFQRFPASYSFLRMTAEVSPYGTNNTQFANTIQAYNDLSPLMKQIVNNLWVSHSATKAYGEKDSGDKGGHKGNSLYAMKETKSMELTGKKPIADQHHPVVITHSESGESALFISETFTNGIVGMTHAEGSELIMLLQRHITQDKYLFDVGYEANQVTMWDNRQLIHRGLINDTSCRRVIQRVSVSSGHIPVALHEMKSANGDFQKALAAAVQRKATDVMSKLAPGETWN